MYIIKVFVNNTNLTFLTFLYNISIRLSLKNVVVSLSPTGGNFKFLLHLDAYFVQKWQKCQTCVIWENLEWNKLKIENLDYGSNYHISVSDKGVY